ncbi:hypothetical protein GCM10009804_71960 [Kribbella hippodromi]|uniref:Uncharacterized protein n=1 Tax=Kribbella hippodromi TaxID=434347 RepID=A0ABP4QA38_9ACTN
MTATSTSPRSSYLMRAGLVRNVRSGEHLTTFVVSGVATVLITRLLLSLSGYPQIGGKGLHIAHVLPGGLLMLISIALLLGYVGPVVRPAAATVGGIGFGLFIDEVGKFVTSDNNYFYKPTAAIVYVVFVLIVLGFRFLTTRRPIDQREELANVIDHAVEGIAGGLSRRRRAEAVELLGVVDRGVPGRRETEDLLAVCPPDEVELAAPVDAAWRALQRGFERLATHPKAPTVAVVVLAVQVVGEMVIAAVAGEGIDHLPVLGVTVGSLLSAMFTVRGALALRKGNRARAVRLFELAVLVSLLMTQVFQFAATQFAAAFGMLLDLVMLGLLRAERERMRRVLGDTGLGGTGKAAVGTPKTPRQGVRMRSLPPDPAQPPFPEDPSDPV